MRQPFRISALVRRSRRALVCAFFLAFLALGLLTVPDYGQPWDEVDEMDILRMNLWEYARAFQMDEDVFEALAARDTLSINALVPISQSVERDHGQCAFYPLAGLVLDKNIDGRRLMLLWHGYCWVLFTLGAFALYACCRQLGLPRWTGLLAAAFLLLSPRFFAEGHYNNKDIVLFSLCLCTLWQGLALMRQPGFLRALAFSFFGAAAANTKLAGLAVWGLCALFVLLVQIARKRLDRRALLVGLTTLSSLVCFYTLLTPAMWSDPAGFFRHLVANSVAFSRWENYVLFRGTVFATYSQPLPRYYLPYMVLATTPLWLLLLMAAGQAAALYMVVRGRSALLRSDQAAGLLLVSLLWLLPLGFAIASRTPVYNGWRHFYFLYGPLLLLAAYGAHTLLSRRRALQRPGLRAVSAAVLAVCMACGGLGLAVQHPYTYTYYQPLVQARNDGAFLELDYWNVSVHNALNQLLDQTTGELRVGYADAWAEAGLRRGTPALPADARARITIVDDPREARYVLANPTYTLYSGFTPQAGASVLVSVEAYGLPIMLVYQNNPGPTGKGGTRFASNRV